MRGYGESALQISRSRAANACDERVRVNLSDGCSQRDVRVCAFRSMTPIQSAEVKKLPSGGQHSSPKTGVFCTGVTTMAWDKGLWMGFCMELLDCRDWAEWLHFGRTSQGLDPALNQSAARDRPPSRWTPNQQHVSKWVTRAWHNVTLHVGAIRFLDCRPSASVNDSADPDDPEATVYVEHQWPWRAQSGTHHQHLDPANDRVVPIAFEKKRRQSDQLYGHSGCRLRMLRAQAFFILQFPVDSQRSKQR